MLTYVYNTLPPKFTVIDADVKMCVYQYTESVPVNLWGEECAWLLCIPALHAGPGVQKQY